MRVEMIEKEQQGKTAQYLEESIRSLFLRCSPDRRALGDLWSVHEMAMVIRVPDHTGYAAGHAIRKGGGFF
jgi:hypothetical protein